MSARQSFGRIITAQAQADPNRIVIVSDDEGACLTAAQLDSVSNRLARTYRRYGVTRNSLVMVSLANTIEFVTACVAIWKAGAVPNVVNPEMADTERAILEQVSKPALAVGSRPTSPGIGWIPQGFSSDESDARLSDSWSDHWKAATTSGSTGTPKVVLANAPALADPKKRVAPFLPRLGVQLVAAPLWHSAQFTYAFRGLLTGQRLVLADTFDEYRFVALVDRHQATWTMLSPSAIHRLVGVIPRDAELASLQQILHLGAPCVPADKHALITRLGAEKVTEVYAGSESNGLTMITGAEWLDRLGSVGKPISGTEIRIQRADGSLAAPGEVGEVWMRRGDTPAYVYRGGRSRRTDDGWDTLGDLGCLDGDGYLFIADRAADVIDRNGDPVYPSRVEHALLGHPHVRDAVVVAGPEGRVSAVVDIAGHRADAEELLRFVRPHLTANELPSHISFTRSPLRNHAGKVRRSTFRASCPSAMSA